ncbi:MAG TPA: diguanylate cyclase [Solirubrobacteraceae bacterium]|jgi:diguanylate cyclase (GGDEF)-like protein|nr:diguanylate cyclase [Solirubrobacteraceae bacterium]
MARTRDLDEQTSGVAQLGAALADHVGAVLERVCAREAPPLATAARSALARICVLETLAVARWIAGEPAELLLKDTRETAELLEELAARGSVSAREVELRCEHLTEAILAVLAERAELIGASPAALAKAGSLAQTGLAFTVESAREAFAAAALPGRDSRTGLPGPALTIDRADQLLARARREQTTVVALMIDPGFSATSEIGADAAARLLRRVAARLDEIVRAGDTLGHLEHERFVVIAADAAPAELLATLSERVESVFAAPFEIADDEGSNAAVSLQPRLACAAAAAGGGEDLVRAAQLALRHAAARGNVAPLPA